MRRKKTKGKAHPLKYITRPLKITSPRVLHKTPVDEFGRAWSIVWNRQYRRELQKQKYELAE